MTDYVQLALDAGQLVEAGAQWVCSSRCWQEGDHDETCYPIQFYSRPRSTK